MIRRVPLTRGRLIALCVGVPLALAVIAAAAFDAVAYAGQGSYPVRQAFPAHGSAVQVSVKQGDLRVRQVGGHPGLRGTVRYSLARPTVTWHATAAAVTVSSRCIFSLGVCGFDYRLALPPGARLTLVNNLGNITATSLFATNVTAINQSGDITLIFSAIPAHVVVSDQLGDVTIVLPPGGTSYRVMARAGLGDTSIRVPTSPTSAHVIRVTDTSGDIVIR